MEEPTVVVRFAPLTRRTEEPVKFVPVAVSVKAELPVSTVVGLMLPRVGAAFPSWCSRPKMKRATLPPCCG